MSFPAIRIVDLHHDNEVIELSDLTETALGSLIYECERLLDEIKDAHRKEVDNEADADYCDDCREPGETTCPCG